MNKTSKSCMPQAKDNKPRSNLKNAFPMVTKKLINTSCLFALSFTLGFSATAQADEALLKRNDVQDYINDFSKKYDVPKAQLEDIFEQVTPREEVINKTKHPAEAMTWSKYKKLFITQTKINNGVKFWHEHQAVLAKAEKEYGVPASIIIATIGIESNYGHNQGKFRVIDALADLAFNYPSRSKFFKFELTEFLIMTLVEQHQDPMQVLGSYAGAIGMVQFMPHSYRNLAVDYSNSGNIDLTNDADDAIGSVASYYSHFEWHYHQPVASYAKTDRKTQLLEANKTYSEQALLAKGYVNSNSWPKDIEQATLIDLIVTNGHEYWLGYHNFSVIEKYNRSPLYAMAVYQLSRKIEDSYNKAYNAPSKNVQ